ncbi:glutaredoxin-related protein [Mobilisporobacter senegalensis]|uniref:Glutaredoxin-related protein n=1 Tax=Mobilisporobacter senegalensis TaxID=1329262 RepID=A0A3N1XB12_9FIRM|nr:glutaredoxin [Mobilisporobacter senegalensis]ROR23933.1 glutaredoxin-related protein [Mobilisporobacter senegalensis]
MKIVMYGSEICPDCIKDKEILMNCNDIELDYRNITKDTKTLKEFLSYRDHEAMFTPIIDNGKIGIPFFILEDGRKTFEIYDYINMKKPDVEQTANACSIDGKGNC